MADTAIDTLKRTLRKRTLQQRDTIDAAERARRSTEIARLVDDALASALPDGALISAYSAMNSEVDLSDLFDAAALRAWRFCFPCMMNNDDALGPRHVMRFFAAPADAPASAWRTLPFVQKPLRSFDFDEPALANCEAIDPRDIDAVISPLVAFDDAGNRLGYGGGNYDRFFEKLNPQALIVGVAFREQRVDAVPIEAHDIALPRIIVG